MKDGKKKVVKKVLKHIKEDDKEFMKQIADDKNLKKSLLKERKKKESPAMERKEKRGK